jgi:hypothetical protein
MFYIWAVGETFDWEGRGHVEYFASESLARTRVQSWLEEWEEKEQVPYFCGYHLGQPDRYWEWRYADSPRALFLERLEVVDA